MDKGTTLVNRSPENIVELASLLADPSPSTSDAFHHMDAIPPVLSWKGQMPIDLFPKELRPLVLKSCLSNEVIKLDKMLLRAHFRHVKQEEEIIKLIHLYSVLYFVYSEADDLKKDLDKFYAYTLLVEEKTIGFCQGPYLSDAGDGFWKLLDSQKELYRDFCSGDCQSYDTENGKASYNSVLTEALKLCSERKFPLLLHLLVDVAKIDVNEFIDDMCHTRALHHAAISGNLSAISYLLSKGAELNIKDRYGCTPLHYASMFGHKMTAEYLISQDTNCSVINSTCSNEYTADDYSKALSAYMQIRGVEQDSFAHAHNDAYLLTRHHLQKLKTNWSSRGIVKSVNEITVDMNDKESADVQEAVVNTMKMLLLKVAGEKSIFKGELRQLGSSADGVRLFCPDEFDFNLILSSKTSESSEGGLRVEIKEYDERTAANKGHNCYVSVTPLQEDSSHWAKGSELLPELLRLMKLGLKDLDIKDSRLCVVPPGVRHKMVGIGLTLRWCGKKYPLLLIDVDLVPVIHATWPENLHRPPLLTDDVQSSIYASTSLTNEWRLSSGILENNIMLNLTKERKDVFLACKRLVSTLKVNGWVPTQIKQQYRYFDNQLFKLPILNGFILKNCFFQEMEERREDEHWQEGKLLERVDSIFQKMCNQDNDDSGYYVPSQVYAYFGGATLITEKGEQVVRGATDKSYIGYGAPEILEIVRSLKCLQNQAGESAVPSTSQN